MKLLLRTPFEKYTAKLLLMNRASSVAEHFPTNSLNCLRLSPRNTTYPPGIPTSSCIIRWAHTDIKVPDFSEYRRPSCRCSNVESKKSVDERRAFSYFMTAACWAGALYSTKAIMWHFVTYMAASGDVLAMAKIEIKLSEIPEGSNITYKWRGNTPWYLVNLGSLR